MDWNGVSAVVAAVAAGIALWSITISRQALKVSLRTEQRAQAPFEIYLVEAYVRRSRRERRRLYVFRIVVTNKSDLPNSLRSVELNILYVRHDAAASTILVPHNAKDSAALRERVETLAVPSAVPARGVVSGVAIFAVTDEVLAGSTVDSYQMTVSDALSRIARLDVSILQEHEDEQEVAPGRDPSSE
jgi:hypothetical protein